jgi:hypothetical protein
MSKDKKAWVAANWDAVNDSNKTYNREHAREIRAKKLVKYWPGSTWQEAEAKYDALFAAQSGGCALCGKAETRRHEQTGTIWDLAVDHDHVTGRVRGLLCNRHNRGLGLLGDTEDDMKRVLRYLGFSLTPTSK